MGGGGATGPAALAGGAGGASYSEFDADTSSIFNHTVRLDAAQAGKLSAIQKTKAKSKGRNPLFAKRYAGLGKKKR